MRADILQLIVDRSDEELVKLIDLHQRRLDGGALTQNGILVHTKILAAEREELSNRAIKRELENE